MSCRAEPQVTCRDSRRRHQRLSYRCMLFVEIKCQSAFLSYRQILDEVSSSFHAQQVVHGITLLARPQQNACSVSRNFLCIKSRARLALTGLSKNSLELSIACNHRILREHTSNSQTLESIHPRSHIIADERIFVAHHTQCTERDIVTVAHRGQGFSSCGRRHRICSPMHRMMK